MAVHKGIGDPEVVEKEKGEASEVGPATGEACGVELAIGDLAVVTQSKASGIEPSEGLKITDYPNDLLRMIMDYLGCVDATAFGLTCKQFYEHYHLAYPELVRLSSKCPGCSVALSEHRVPVSARVRRRMQRQGQFFGFTRPMHTVVRRTYTPCPLTGKKSCTLLSHMQNWAWIPEGMEYVDGRLRWSCWSLGGKLKPMETRVLRSATKAEDEESGK